ncbi:MAG: hypothetical protein E6X21_17005 [Clostridium sp.]|uniref:hypothetical protein n=1 Tax=Clostridium sp. TaxID=1506 RepID=UPI00290C4C53|nr:hypothetical protein [Clostridium sp.]
MKNEILKIGQERIIKIPITIKGVLSEENIEIKPGDRVLIMKNGLKFLTGNARGKQTFEEREEKLDFDIENISKRILESIKYSIGSEFEELLEGLEIKESMIIEYIEEELENFI